MCIIGQIYFRISKFIYRTIPQINLDFIFVIVTKSKVTLDDNTLIWTLLSSVSIKSRLTFLMNSFLYDITVTFTNEESRYFNTGSFSVVGHDEVLWVFIFFIVDYDTKFASEGLNVLCFDNKVAVSSVYDNYRSRSFFLTILEMLTLEVRILEWFASICVIQRIV